MNTNLFSLAQKPAFNPANLDELDGVEHYALTPIEHDYAGRTPLIWNTLYQKFGLETKMAMIIVDPKNVRELVSSFRSDPKYIGGGAGVGFKDELPKILDELDPLAEAVQSVNVIKKMSDGHLKGYNTDGLGYRESLLDIMNKQELVPEKIKVIMLGAGGTGNSIAFALADCVQEIVILNRSLDKAIALAEKVNSFAGRSVCRAGGEDQIPQEVETADVVINVSTKGATGSLEKYSSLAPAVLPDTEENIKVNLAQSEVVLQSMHERVIVSDIVLRNDDSPLLTMAKQKGIQTLDGLPMVLNQGVEAFWLIHGEELQARGIDKNQVREIVKSIV